ncbi:hypothetical protein F4808DRAFT_462560 [Astrocystis sublimbata]|nr:hypothetical protein F4808DRAFT_462560 [Astrocystis sublimbata]
MNRHDTGNLIDLDDDSPPTTTTSSPFSTISPPDSLPPHPRDNTHASSLIDFDPNHHLPLHQPQPQYQPKPSSPPPLTSNPSGSGYGIGSGLWGLLRRISTVDGASAPTPPPGASQLYNQNAQRTFGGGGDGIHGAFTPPRRTATPRGLPSLDPVCLSGYHADTDADERLLARGVAEEIRTFLPERLKILEDWRLVYSLYQNGSSLSTLYQLCERYRGVRAGFVLVVRDGTDGIFGAYLTEAPHPASSYFGTGECFLWRASLHAPLPPPPSADTTDLDFRTTTIVSPTTSSSLTPDPSPNNNNDNDKRLPSPIPSTQSVRFQTFAYTGANDYCMFCETKFLSVGGGHGERGRFGLWLNDGLSRGHSAECDTFLNQPLSDEGEKFDVMGVELWVVGAS